ncbi:MAG: response regulator [Candidatus Acidiferrales bacterium]
MSEETQFPYPGDEEQIEKAKGGDPASAEGGAAASAEATSVSDSAEAALRGDDSAECATAGNALAAENEGAGPDNQTLAETNAGEAVAEGMSATEKPPTRSDAIAAEGAAKTGRNEDRRRRRRALISAPVRVRGVNVTRGGPDEISTTVDVSRDGLLVLTEEEGYYRGMEVAVIFPYSTAPTAIHAEQSGRVARIVELPDGRTAVAIALGVVGSGLDLVDASGRKLVTEEPQVARTETNEEAQAESRKLQVLVVDAEAALRGSMKAYLEVEGYRVIAVATSPEARQVLDLMTPALIIAEVEGENLPGYELCAHVKTTPRLKQIPVVLTTKSAYPSDYSSAHQLGAIVCMAKPFKLERLGHVARLLAPPPTEKVVAAAAGAAGTKADPTRRVCSAPHAGAGRGPVAKNRYDESTTFRRKLRFPSFR